MARVRVPSSSAFVQQSLSTPGYLFLPMCAVLRCGEVPSEPRAHVRTCGWTEARPTPREGATSCHPHQDSTKVERPGIAFFAGAWCGLKVRVDDSWRLPAPALPMRRCFWPVLDLSFNILLAFDYDLSNHVNMPLLTKLADPAR